MRKAVASVLLLFVGIILGFLIKSYWPNKSVNSVLPPKLRPLEKYTIESLSQANVVPAEIQMGTVIKDNPTFTSYNFSFNFDPTLQNKSVKKVTGLINIPKTTTEKKFPIVLMIRGYVDPTQYFTGEGTEHAAEVFAQNGFITVAPDFLGYAGSDKEAEDVFESRFQTYTTTMTLLKSMDGLKDWDGNNLFIWAHSNGGQIALTTLEITKSEVPTVLWAPVSKPFPYSILYYTDDSADLGKSLRAKLSTFEEDYDVNNFSLTNYLDQIQAPLDINQGTADMAVPVTWTDTLVKTLKDDKKDITYYKYPGADHNMTPGWNLAIERSLKFYKIHLK